MPSELIILDDSVKFDDTADVVVIGLGAAGASAAIQALAAGADVLILERASAGGGSTAYSGGYVYLGGGTRVQRVNGFDDTVDDMYNYLMAVTPYPDAEKIRLYCDRSLEHFEWLEDQGLKFNDGFYPDKCVEHSTDDGLAWTGNEKVWPYKEKARPMPRGHKITKPGGQQELGEGGRQMMTTLIQRCEEVGARIVCDANVKNLIKDESGRIVGIRYRQFEGEKTVAARKGVVVSTGGFAMSKEMSRRYCPLLADERINIVGATYSDGSGIELGLSAGGITEHISYLITSPIYPPASLLKGVIVNKFGRRFVAEDSYHGRTTGAILREPDQTAYLICDNSMFARPEFGMPLIDAWETIAEMERDLNLPEGKLQKTIETYNRNAAKKEDPDLHKSAEWLQPLTEPPFAALDCSLGRAWYSGFSLGGLKTSARAEVLDGSGRPIQGLYAAGACATNIAQDGMGYSSGTCIGESTFFGRQAGASAVLLSPWR